MHQVLSRFAVIAAALSLALPLATSSTVDKTLNVRPNDELAEQMGLINRSIRKMKKKLEKKEDAKVALGHVETMQKALLACKSMVPDSASKVPEGEKRDKFVAEYRKMQIAFFEKVLELEKALVDRDMKTAAKVFKEVRGYKKKGHDKFE